MENKSIFETLVAINCNEHTEKKNGLTYLSWAWAWDTVKRAYPKANFEICENRDGWNYFTDGRTAWVKTMVSIEDETHTMMLPVMDFRNASIPLEKITSFDVNKAIMRCLAKNLAMFGLGLYIYAGEDLPEGDNNDDEVRAAIEKVVNKAEKPKPAPKPVKVEPMPTDEGMTKGQIVMKFITENKIDAAKVSEWMNNHAKGIRVDNLDEANFKDLMEYLGVLANG